MRREFVAQVSPEGLEHGEWLKTVFELFFESGQMGQEGIG